VVFKIIAFFIMGTGGAGRLGLGPGWDPGQSRVFLLVIYIQGGHEIVKQLLSNMPKNSQSKIYRG
jgi:hypothetical protein